MNLSKEEMEKIFKAMDLDCSGQIDYSGYLLFYLKLLRIYCCLCW